MRDAWWSVRDRRIEQVELINIAPREELLRSWDPFITRHHFEVKPNFYDSWCATYPRRSCEACWDQFMEMHIRQPNSIPAHADFDGLNDWIRPLLEVELAAHAE
jgi:hypothetical protein